MPDLHNKRHLLEDQTRKLYEHTVFGTLATLVNSCILVVVLRTLVAPVRLLTWLGFVLLVSVCRLVLQWCYRTSRPKRFSAAAWAAWFNVTLFMTGLIWGSTAVVLFPVGSESHQVFIAFVVGGMVAGAAGAFTSLLSSFFVFSLPALLPLIIRFITIGNDIHMAMGVMASLFLVLISLTALRMHRDILYQLSLKYQKGTLVADLQREVYHRKAAQDDLRRQKQRVEEIVASRTAELKSANVRLRAIINHTPLIIWVVDRKGVLTFCDGKGLEKIGYESRQVIGKSIFDLFDTPHAIVSNTWRVLAGEPVSDTVSINDAVFEIRLLPLANTADGLAGAIGVAMDITERTLAKEALRKEEEKFRELVENINDVLYVADKEGRITYISPVIESVLGYRADEMIGGSLFDYAFQQDCELLQKEFSRALEISKVIGEYRFWDKSSQLKWCRVSFRPVQEGKDGYGIQGVLVDITRSKRLEEELQRAQKMEALGTMAGGVAHDLNNMLSGIVSYPELLLMELPQDSPLREPLTIIKKSGENAAAIVQDLLTLARRGVAMIEFLDLNRIVEECIHSPEINRLQEAWANIEIKPFLQSDLLHIYGSSVHILKSLANLISNAIEAMPHGGKIDVTTANRYVDRPIAGFDTVEEGEYVVLGVADTGIGIPESDRARIFEPFYTKKVMGRSGSGLGMAVVWGTIKDHKGYIDIRSEVGSGTRIELYFPATRDELKENRKQPELKDFHGRGELVMVVDDMPLQRQIASDMLRRLGYRVKAAASGEEAVEFFREQAADLVILDMIMTPGMDGYETYRRIVDLRPGQKAIIASGYSESDQVRKTQELGAGKYIKKPYSLVALGMAIKNELNSSN